MNVEQRLIDALRSADQVEPSPDLWSRVVHSIEEDQAHRRRVVNSTLFAGAVVAALFLLGLLGLTDGPYGRYVRLPVLQVIQFVVLVMLVAVLGPAIRRFGRGYATDLWRATPETATALVKLLDVAYVLVFAGYILLTGQLDLTTSNVIVGDCRLASVDCPEYLPDQLRFTAFRVGGLLLVMGLLHALSIMVLPVVALVSNSTRVGKALPRWLVILLTIAGVGVGLLVLPALVGLVAGAS